jgi:hypothetical protein
MQYMFLHAIDEGIELDEGDAVNAQNALNHWIEDSIHSGVNLHGSRLRPTGDATTVRIRSDEVIVTDGPFAETKEQVAGYDVLECDTLEDALAWAAQHPTALAGSIEVRALMGDPPRATLPDPKKSTKRYLLLVCVGEDVQLTPEESQRMGPATDQWIATAEKTDARLFGNQLEPVSVARTVRVRDGEVMVTDGPFAETKEQIAGFDILECRDLDVALDLAALHPVARIGAMEVRPLWPFDEA